MKTASCRSLAASTALLALSLLGGGCASITGTNTQAVSVQTREQAGREVPGVACELNNNKGKWFITTPGSVVITRSNDDLQVLCNKAGHAPGRAAVTSATKGAMFGNIIFGGGIGAVIDHNSGAAYEYPGFFQVVMGTFIKVDPPADTGGEAQASPSSPQAQPATTPPAPGVDERLADLKRRHEAGRVTSEIYLEQQRRILEAAR